jgi:hypothetical protein
MGIVQITLIRGQICVFSSVAEWQGICIILVNLKPAPIALAPNKMLKTGKSQNKKVTNLYIT